MIKKHFAAWLLFCLILFATAAAEPEQVRYALEFNRIGASVRAAAMGNAFAAAEAEASHLYWNSANLANLETRDMYFQYSEPYNDFKADNSVSLSRYNACMLGVPLPSGVGIGTGYARYDIADIPMYPYPPGTETERINNYDMRLDGTPVGNMQNVLDEITVSSSKSYHIELPRGTFYSLPAPIIISIGGSFKFLRNKIETFPDQGETKRYYGLNANMDAGALIQFGLLINPKTRYIERKFSLGVNFQDILKSPVTWQGSLIDYEETTERNMKVGMAYLERTPWVHGSLLLTTDIDREYEKIDHFGIEYSFLNTFALRAGLDNRHPTVGAGISWKFFRFDYAYNFHPLSHTPLQLGLRISL